MTVVLSSSAPVIPANLQIAVLLVGALATAMLSAAGPRVRRLLLAASLAVGFAAVLVVIQPATMPGTPHPIIDCDYFWWTVECIFR